MNPMRKLPELLAPAGSLDALYAAIKGGADAVYFGGLTANARNSAKNFSDEEISHSVRLLHDNGRSAYITLNILHTDRELPDVLRFAEYCYINGADAFIIQDIGLSRVIKKYFSDIKIHASTQAAGHNLYSARQFHELGFSRMVIARESDRENLKNLINNSPIEIEMFVHGALCSSHSGRCFLSAALGNTRSANRGMCAQPCRLKYNGGYILSLKDQCLAGHIKEITELSPASLKIEGRMKPPEYVYNICKIYRACLDENRNAEKSEIDFLAGIFSRQGFTDGYFTRSLGTHMYGIRTEENKTESKKHAKDFEKINIVIPKNIYNHDINPKTVFTHDIKNIKNIKINPKLCLIFNSHEQLTQVAEYIKIEDIVKKIYKIFVPIETKPRIPDELINITGVRLPYVIFDSELKQVEQNLKEYKNIGIKHALVDNIGHIDIALRENLELFGNFGLNITNSYTLDEYAKMGFKDIILSPELNFAQIRDINKSVNCGITAYGRTHVMISENNIINSEHSNNFYIIDKTGAKFFVREDFKNRNIIYNSVPVYLADKKDLYKNLGLFFVSLNFTDERSENIKKIIADYALNKDNIKPPEKFTRGYK